MDARLRFLLLAAMALVLSCVQTDQKIDRDNPLDPGGTNYHPPTVSAGASRATAALGDTVTITAHAHDANGTIIAIAWAPDGKTFSIVGLDSVLRVQCLTPGQLRVLVEAVDNDSLVSAVDTVTIRVMGNAPALAGPPNGSTLTTLTPVLFWQPGYYNARFAVLLDTVNPPLAIGTDSMADTVYSVPRALMRGRTYFWEVIGYSADNLQEASDVWSFTTPGNSSVMLDDGLVAYFPFSGNALDASGNNLRTAVNGATLTSDRFGAANSAYMFNGTTDDIEVADTAAISFANSQDFSISLWLAFTSAKANMLPLLKYQSGGSTGYFFDINSSAPGYCGGAGVASFIAGEGSPACAAAAINDGAWHHLVALYAAQANTITLYIDGTAQTKTGSRGNGLSVAAPLLIGGLPGFYPYSGSIDDVRIYNRVLASTEIDSLYHQGGWPGK
jgi:Concanavalin A-like lectin/glucanases superfamily